MNKKLVKKAIKKLDEWEEMNAMGKRLRSKEVPVASPELTAQLEEKMIKKFSPFLGKIKDMSNYRFDILFIAFAGYDFQRGLVPGMIPHIRYEHSKKFKKFESRLLDEMSDRADQILLQNISEKSEHPWLEQYPIPRNAKAIILGTHPPMPYNASVKFFYGNIGAFWSLLAQVYPNETFFINDELNLQGIQDFLNRYELGITDMVSQTYNFKFSTDRQMDVAALNPHLKEWLWESEVRDIFITSSSGSNGVLSLFKKWLNRKTNYSIKIPEVSAWKNNSFEFSWNGRNFRLIRLFSPSPTAKRGLVRNKSYLSYIEQNPTGNLNTFIVDSYRKLLPLAK